MEGKRLLEEFAKLPWDSMCVESCTPWAEGEGKAEAFPPPEVVQVIVILWVHDFNSNMSLFLGPYF
jgi:hypothetical protein